LKIKKGVGGTEVLFHASPFAAGPVSPFANKDFFLLSLRMRARGVRAFFFFFGWYEGPCL
jgi:hypothetical protein